MNMHTIFERKSTHKKHVTFKDLLNEQSRVLPKREEMNVMNYNMGHPYGMGDDGYSTDYHNSYSYGWSVDCYEKYYNYSYHPAQFEHYRDGGGCGDGGWEGCMQGGNLGYSPTYNDPYLSGGYNPYIGYGGNDYMNTRDYYNGAYGYNPGYGM